MSSQTWFRNSNLCNSFERQLQLYNHECPFSLAHSATHALQCFANLVPKNRRNFRYQTYSDGCSRDCCCSILELPPKSHGMHRFPSLAALGATSSQGLIFELIVRNSENQSCICFSIPFCFSPLPNFHFQSNPSF